MRIQNLASLAVVVTASLLASAGCQTTAETTGQGECTSDSDCKGDRVCEDGECVAPGGTSTSSQGPGGGEETCSGEEVMCAGADSMKVCDGGTFVTESCSESCGYYGFSSLGCQTDRCECGETTNAYCDQGMQAVCVCLEAAGEPCTDDDYLSFYIACHTGDPETGAAVGCFSSHVSGNEIDCAQAANDCL